MGLSHLPSSDSNHAPLIGLIVGLCAAMPMYLWQSKPQAAVACFVIFGYTSWLWAATRLDITQDRSMRRELRHMPVNRTWRRIMRLVFSAAFWWSILFGGSMVVGSLWFTGLHEVQTLALIGGIWCLIALCLNYGLTMQYPTTRCRRCSYQLLPHMNPQEPHESIRCPECGTVSTAAQLCLGETRARRLAGQEWSQAA